MPPKRSSKKVSTSSSAKSYSPQPGKVIVSVPSKLPVIARRVTAFNFDQYANRKSPVKINRSRIRGSRKKTGPRSLKQRKILREELVDRQNTLRSEGHRWWTPARYNATKTFIGLHHRVSRPRAVKRMNRLFEKDKSQRVASNGLTKRLSRSGVDLGIFQYTRGGIPSEGLVEITRTSRGVPYKHMASRIVQYQSKQKYEKNKNMQAWGRAVSEVSRDYRQYNEENRETKGFEKKVFSLQDKDILNEVRNVAARFGFVEGAKYPLPNLPKQKDVRKKLNITEPYLKRKRGDWTPIG